MSTPAPLPAPPANSVRHLAVSGRVWYTKAISRSYKGLLFFCFVVPKWYPTLQNHAVTAYAVLFAGFGKTPISYGSAPSTYETICRLITADLAIQAIINFQPPWCYPQKTGAALRPFRPSACSRLFSVMDCYALMPALPPPSHSPAAWSHIYSG